MKRSHLLLLATAVAAAACSESSSATLDADRVRARGAGEVRSSLCHDVVHVREHDGCGPAFWSTNAEVWWGTQWTPTGFDPADRVGDVFRIPPALGDEIRNATLVDALAFNPTGHNTFEKRSQRLLAQAVAALLSAGHPDVNYPRTAAGIVAQVNDALTSGNNTTVENLKDALLSDNSLGYPGRRDGDE